MNWEETARAVIEDVILDVGVEDLAALEAAIKNKCPFTLYSPDYAHRIWKRSVAAYLAELRSSYAKTPDDTKYFWVPKPAEKIAEEAAEELIEWRQSIADEKENKR